MSRFRWLLAAVVLLSLCAGAAAAAFYVTFLRDLPSFDTLADYRPALTSTVVDRKGRSVGEFFEFRREITPLADVPEPVIQAFLAAEDKTFYEHSGVDYLSILRAAWANLRAGGETVQGASTITQQMVKQLLLSPEQTYRRKIRELILAQRIEQRFSKDQILFLYLNQIYFGAGAYGIGEAARTYFGKSIGDVSPGEAALLAGLPKAPGRNSPYLNPERAEERRLYVLDRMLEEGFIDAPTHLRSRNEAPALQPRRVGEDFEVASYFTEEVRRVLVELLGNDALLRGGLRIETTMDIDLQRAAVDALRNGIEELDGRRGYRGPLRKISADDRVAEIERLAEVNELIAEEGLPIAESEPAPGARLEALVLGVDKEHLQAALAPGYDVEVDNEGITWARSSDGRRIEAKDLREHFAPGDVIQVRLKEEAKETASSLRPARLAQMPDTQGALLSFDVESGDVLAMVGGYDFENSEFNRATQAMRQPGSAFKPIVYASALAGGYTPASVIVDRPIVIETEGFVWRPENYGRKFLGPLLMSEALARSVNNATIHLLRDVGIDDVMDFAKQVGIQSPMERNLGLALGSNPLTLLEITRAYGVFAGGGKRVRPRMVARVTDREGNVLLEDLRLGEDPPPAVSAPEDGPLDVVDRDRLRPLEGLDENEPELPAGYAITPQEAFLATAVLRQVVEHPKGTGRRARSLGHPLAGKTGTTNDQADAWFVGYSPDVATGVWVGFDEKQVLGRGETGGRAALPIWIDYMKAALEQRPVREFPVPEGIVFARIDGKTGLLASSRSEAPLFQPFLEGTVPTETSDPESSVRRDRRRLDF